MSGNVVTFEVTAEIHPPISNVSSSSDLSSFCPLMRADTAASEFLKGAEPSSEADEADLAPKDEQSAKQLVVEVARSFVQDLRETPHLRLTHFEDSTMSTEPSIDGEERGMRNFRRKQTGESSLTRDGQILHSGYESSGSDIQEHDEECSTPYYEYRASGLNRAYQKVDDPRGFLASNPVPTDYLQLPSETTPLLKVKVEDRPRAASNASTVLSSPHDDASYQSFMMSDRVSSKEKSKFMNWANLFKVSLLTSTVIFAVIVMSVAEEPDSEWTTFSLNDEEPVYVNLRRQLSPTYPILRLKASGPFLPESLGNLSDVDTVFALVRRFPDGSHEVVEGHQPLIVPTAPPSVVTRTLQTTVEHTFRIPVTEVLENAGNLEILVQAKKLSGQISVSVLVNPFTEFTQISLLMATIVLVGLYVLIIFELCHRTLAAMLGATAAIACLALIGDRPDLEKVVSWLDVETLCLLFGMMVIVAILCETGFFDYMAVLAFRVAGGKVWPMITTLCLFTAVISAFLDNVTTILLMTAVTIKLCEVMNLDPRKVLITLVIFSNIGGAGTPIGDPPNVIIISNAKVLASGVNFTTFTLHLLPGVVISAAAAYIFLRLYYRDDTSLRHQQPQEVVEIQHEIDIWQKACRSLSEYSRDESYVRTILKKKVKNLKTIYRKKLVESSTPSKDDFKHNLEQLSAKYKIRNWPLLIKSGVVLSVVIILFFLQSIPELNLSLGWIAIFGALALLVLADTDELEGIFGRVEWTTLLFFAALFVVMEALTELGLLQYIGDQTETWILAVNKEHRLVVGILIITWVSAIASCFIDNIPFTTVMVKIVAKLGESDDLDLPVQPLIYALAFGACFGGNGTLIGASANVVCAGVAEHHGYRFTFMDFFRVGFPVMIVTTLTASCWLLFTHAFLEWH